MAIDSVFAVQDAYENGRFHQQRFIKTGAGQGNDGRWQDWAFQAGQPAYDARIGVVNTLTPIVAQRNDAIYFPPIPAGQQRVLHSVSMRPLATGASQASIDFTLFDLVAYYPLIDGDSTDPQDMDNTMTLPRYETGEGLQLVMVTHVAPAVQGGQMILEYTDSNGVDHTVTRGVSNNGLNVVCSCLDSSGATISGPLGIALDPGVTGVRRVNRVTYAVPPGGLHCLYLIKPLAHFQHYQDAYSQALNEKCAVEVDFALKDAGRMPIILDGAHLSFFYRPNGGGRSVTFFGDAHFVWG